MTTNLVAGNKRKKKGSFETIQQPSLLTIKLGHIVVSITYHNGSKIITETLMT